MINSQYKKITQALRYLISRSDNDKVNILLLMKLIWAADRYHARKYSSLITGFDYRALPKGPVSSTAMDIANGSEFLSPEQVEYSQQFVARKIHDIVGKNRTETDYLSETDIEALNFAWETFGGMDKIAVVDITHKYPEWKKFEAYFNTGASSEEIDVMDFFDNPTSDEYFTENKEQLELSRAKFKENLGIRKLVRG